MCIRENLQLLKSERQWGRLFFYFPPEQIPAALNVFRYIIGLHSFTPAFSADRDYTVLEQTITEFARGYLEDGDSFAIRSRRIKPYPLKSMEIDRKIGSAVFLDFQSRGKKIPSR